MTEFLKKHKILSLIFLILLIAAMALSFVSCDKSGNVEVGGANEAPKLKTFTFEVIFADGSTNTHSITTSADTVGQALIVEGLLEGEDGPYGLYVKTVDGVTLDYDRDGKYWAFYINGEYAMSGVDTTEIDNGATYAFKAE